MLSIFRRSTPRTKVLFAFYFLIVKLSVVFFQFNQQTEFTFLKFVIPNQMTLKISSIFIGLIVLFLTIVFFNSYINNTRLFEHKNYIVAVNTMLFSSFFVATNSLNPALFLFVITLIIVQLIISLINEGFSKSKILLIGFFSGLLLFCSPIFILMLPFTVFAIVLSRTLSLKDIVMFLLGYIISFYWVWAILFLADGKGIFELLNWASFSLFNFSFTIGDWVLLAVLIIYSLYMSIYIFSNYNNMAFNLRNVIKPLIGYTAGAFLIVFSGALPSEVSISYLVAPLAVISGVLMLINPKARMTGVIHLIFVALIIGLNVFI